MICVRSLCIFHVPTSSRCWMGRQTIRLQPRYSNACRLQLRPPYGAPKTACTTASSCPGYRRRQLLLPAVEYVAAFVV